MGEVYKPREDSYLLHGYVEKLVYGEVLDMGTGSGIQAVAAAKKKEVHHILAVDINPVALKVAEERAHRTGVAHKIKFRLSDLFENVDGIYDWIVFNTPYLPSEGPRYDEASWTGGKTGSEVIRRFLQSASSYLSESGSILMVYSSHSGLSVHDFQSYHYHLLEKKPLFFEEILCVKLTLS